MKYLLVLGVVVLVLWLMLARRPRPPSPRGGGTTPGPAQPQAMVVCAHCGVHLPRGDALLGSGQTFCSVAHRDAGPRKS